MEITANDVATLAALTEPTVGKKFAEIIENYDVDDIKYLLHGAAYRSDEGEILELLWDRALDEGYRKGHREWKKKVETSWDEGYLKGREDEDERTKNAYTSLLAIGRTDERAEWTAAGHGPQCFTVAAVLETKGIQTDDLEPPQPRKTPKLETSTQTSLPAPTHDAGTQIEPPPSNFEATSSEEPQIAVAASPEPTGAACSKNTAANTEISPPFTIDNPHASPPADFISKPPESVVSSITISKSGSFTPVKLSTTPPLTVSSPNLPFSTKNDAKPLT